MKAKKIEISFKKNRLGKELYAENGNIKTYSNNKQVDTKVSQLISLGYNVTRSISHPFVIFEIKN